MLSVQFFIIERYSVQFEKELDQYDFALSVSAVGLPLSISG